MIKKPQPRYNVQLRTTSTSCAAARPARAWPRLAPVRRPRRRRGVLRPVPVEPVAARRPLEPAAHHAAARLQGPVFRDYARRGRPCIDLRDAALPGPCSGLVRRRAYATGRARGGVPGRRSGACLRELATGWSERPDRGALRGGGPRLRDRIGAVEQTVQRQQIVGEARDRSRRLRPGRAAAARSKVAAVARACGSRRRSHVSHAFSEVQIDDAEAFSSFLGQYYAVPRDRVVPREDAGRDRSRRTPRRLREAVLAGKGRPGRVRAAATPQRGPAARAGRDEPNANAEPATRGSVSTRART